MSTMDPKIDAAGAGAAAVSDHGVEPLSQTEEAVKAFVEAHGAEIDGASGREKDGVVRYGEFCAWLRGDAGQAAFGAEFEGTKKQQILQAAIESRTHDKGYSWLDIAAATGGEGSQILYAAPAAEGGANSGSTEQDVAQTDGGAQAGGGAHASAGQAAAAADGTEALRRTADVLDQLGDADGRIAFRDVVAAFKAGHVFPPEGFEHDWAKAVVGLAGDAGKLSSIGFKHDAADGKWYITTEQYVDALLRFYSYN